MSNNQRQLEAAVQGHTPGPWTVNERTYLLSPTSNDPDKGPTEVYEMKVIKHRRDELAFVFAADKANARLIAAAPEMLEALQDAVEVVGEWGEEGEPEWVKRAKAIIAKATNA